MTKNYFILTFISALFFVSEATAQCTPPTLEVSGTATVCSGSSATLTATTNGQEVRWYDAETGGTELGTGTTFETEPVTETTSFWAEARFLASGPGTGGGGKLAPSSSGSSTVNAGTAPWGLAFTATQNFILNSVDVFLSSGTAGTVVILFKDSGYNTLQTFNVAVPAGGSASSPVQHTIPLNLSVAPGDYKLVVESGPAMIRDLGSNAFPFAIGDVGSVTGGTINDSTTNSGVYYFLYNWNFSTLGGEECISDRLEFEVTTIPSPATPDDVELTVCEGTTIGDTDIETETLNWYSSETSVTPFSNTVVLQNNTTYYIAESNENCESPRATVMVTVTPAPEAPEVAAQDFCGNATVADLEAEGETIYWYDTETGGEPLTGDTMLMSDTYYVSQVIGGCESNRAAVEVNIYEAPEAPEAFAQDFCGEAMVAELNAQEAIIWYDVETGGEPLDDETMLVSGIYYAAQAEGSCESSRTAIEVNVYDIPDMPEGETEQDFDEGETLADLAITGDNLTWFADMELQNPLPGTTGLVDDTTYYVTQMINGCVSEPLAVTVNSSLGVDTVSFSGLKVYPNPTTGILSISNAATVTNISIYTLIGQKVFEKELNSQNADINLSSLSAGTYLLKLEAEEAVKTLKIVKQ